MSRPTFASPILRNLDSPAAESAGAFGESKADEKVCRMCGKDLHGHRRYKDHLGYLCKDCEKVDRRRRIPCAECGKPTLPEGLRPWGPVSICNRCFVDHESDPKKRRIKKVSTRHYEEYQKQSIIGVAAVLAFLFVLIMLNWMGCIGEG